MYYTMRVDELQGGNLRKEIRYLLRRQCQEQESPFEWQNSPPAFDPTHFGALTPEDSSPGAPRQGTHNAADVHMLLHGGWLDDFPNSVGDTLRAAGEGVEHAGILVTS
jgi:hypothetical protein